MFKSLSFKKPLILAIFSLAILLLIYLIFNLNSSKGTFNELALSEYPGQTFESIMVTRTTTNTEIYNDTHKINEFLNYMSKINMKERKRYVPSMDSNNDVSLVTLITDKNEQLHIYFFNKNYIGIIYGTSNLKRSRICEIIGDSIDLNSINKLLKDE